MSQSDQSDALAARHQRLTTYLAQDPDNVRLLRDHAENAVQVKAFDAALGSLQHLDALGQSTPDDLALMTHCLQSLHRIDEASVQVKAALATHPDHPWLKVQHAALLLQTRQFEEALAILPESLDNDPSLASLAAEYRIRCLHHLGRLEEAIAFAEQELALRPDDLRIKSSVGPVLYDMGDLDAAAAYAQSVYQQLGSRYDVLEIFAAVALRDGKPDDARKWTQQALIARQDDGRTWLLDGLISFRQGDVANAIESMQQAVTLMPGHAGSHLALGWVHLLNHQPELAKSAFQHGIEASPAFAEAYGCQAIASFVLGQREEATQLARKARLLDPASPTAQYASLLLNGGSAKDVEALGEQLLLGWGAPPLQVQRQSMQNPDPASRRH